MISRSTITESLKKKLINEFSSIINEKDFRDAQTDAQKEKLIIDNNDVENLRYSRNYQNRLRLSDDLRVVTAIDEVKKAAEESGDDELLFSIGDFLNRLDDIAVSSFEQKKFIAKKLLSFEPLIRQLRADGVAWQKIQLFNEEESQRRFNARASDSDVNEIRPGDEFRGVLRGLITDRATRDQLETILNKEALRVSERVRSERLRSGSYVPLLVIGAGVHSAIFTSELLRNNPKLAASAVVIEPRKVLGGQFRAAGGAGFAINSRTRPHDYNDPENNLPGERGNINSMGGGAVLQLPDVENRIYSENATLGLVAAMNSFLSADTALGLEVAKVSRNPAAARDVSVGKYKVELRDPETNERIIIFTDSVVSSTGLGESYLPFDTEDTETQKILGTRKEKFFVKPQGEVPGLPRVATSAEFWEFSANARNWQPITELAGKRIVIVGDADSTQTILEKLHGILSEPTLDTMTSLQVAAGDEQIIDVTIIGAKQADYEEYIAGRRVRYHFVALQYPRKDGNRNNDTITPLEGKAQRLSQGGGGTTFVTYLDENGLDQSVAADLVITGTGFRDKSREIFSDFEDQFAGRVIEKPSSGEINRGLSRPGTVFSVNISGLSADLTILSTGFDSESPQNSARQNVEFSFVTGGISSKKTIQAGEFLSLYRDNTLRVAYAAADEKKDLFQVLKEDDRPIGRQLPGEGIFIVGVAGKDSEFSEEEKASYPAATQDAVKILVNTDAIWRLSAGTARMAQRYVLDSLIGTGWEKKTADQEKKNIPVPTQEGMPSGEKPEYFVLDLADDEGQLPVNSNALNVLSEALSRKLSKWRLNDRAAQELRARSKGNITLQFVRTYKDTYTIVFDPPLYPVSVLREVFADLSSLETRDIRRALKALLSARGSTDRIRDSKGDKLKGDPDPGLDSNADVVKMVIPYRPRLSLKLRYDGKDYRFSGMETDTIDVLEDNPEQKMNVVRYSKSDEGLVKSEFFGGARVTAELDRTIREALTGKPKVAEVTRASQSEKKSNIDLLREQLNVTPESEVTLVQAKELAEAKALTGENFVKLIERYAKNLQSGFAAIAFNELFQVPFILNISTEQRDRLDDIISGARDKNRSGSIEYNRWEAILKLVSGL